MLSIKFEWKEVQADYSICFLCEELIVTKMYQACVVVAGEEILINKKLCHTCKEKIDKEDG